MAHKFLRDDGWFQQVVTGDLGPSSTSTGVLSFLATSLSSDLILASTATTFDVISVSQGSSGTWFCSANATLNSGGGACEFALKLWDGTNVIATAGTFVGAAGSFIAASVSGVLSAPAGNIKLSAVANVGAAGTLVKAATASAFGSQPPATTLTVVRIG